MSAAQPANGPWTVARLLAWTREYFERHNVESPRLCAEILLAHALCCRRLELYTRHESVPPEVPLTTFRAAVADVAKGKPVAYVTGTKDFFSLTFEVTPDVLVPRPETEVLVERTIHLVRQSGLSGARILDVGTGSGCIAIALAKNLPETVVAASDVSEAALSVAKRNAAKHGVAERIEFRAGDLLACWADCAGNAADASNPKSKIKNQKSAAGTNRFDIMVSNPPYIGLSEKAALPANVRDYEPHAALFAGRDGLDVLRRLIADAPACLSSNGHLLTEVAYNQAAAVRGLFEESGWGEIVTYKDDLRHERVVHGRRGAVGELAASTEIRAATRKRADTESQVA